MRNGLRLLDLLDIIEITTRQYRREIQPDRRYALIKAAFPRPDLLAWFDGQIGSHPVLSPDHYLPILTALFAWHACRSFPDRRLILSSRAGGLFDGRAAWFSTTSPVDIWTFNGESYGAEHSLPPDPHQVGLFVGAFETAGDVAALRRYSGLRFDNATRLFLLNDEAWAALNLCGDIPRPFGGGNSMYDGAFCDLGTAHWHAIYLRPGLESVP